MVGIVLLVLLVGFILWGATTKPGRPFSWTMYSGSSKPFLWTASEAGWVLATPARLGLAPDTGYLTVADLQRFLAESTVPQRIEGFIIGSRGSFIVASGDDPRHLVASPLEQGTELALLVSRLRRSGCKPPA